MQELSIRRRLAVLIFAEAAETLVRDIAVQRQVAVVFTRPATNRTVQVKGRDAEVLRATAADVAAVRRHLALFSAELAPFGWEPAYVESVFWGDPAQLMVVRFTLAGVYGQTPGPGAGQAIDISMPCKR